MDIFLLGFIVCHVRADAFNLVRIRCEIYIKRAPPLTIVIYLDAVYKSFWSSHDQWVQILIVWPMGPTIAIALIFPLSFRYSVRSCSPNIDHNLSRCLLCCWNLVMHKRTASCSKPLQKLWFNLRPIYTGKN